MESKVVVITPTIGGIHLKQAIESVSSQSYSYVRHLLVIDGERYLKKVYEILEKVNTWNQHLSISILAENVGGLGFYGHRIFSAFSHLVDDDYIEFLDEDNWYEPNHISNLVEVMKEPAYEWAYSLRRICDPEGKYVCDDDCESLGKATNLGLVDTSTYFFTNEFYRNFGHHWHYGWGGDRHFYGCVVDSSTFASSGKYTLNYRCGTNLNSAQPDMFLKGNAKVKEFLLQNNYKEYPWSKKPI